MWQTLVFTSPHLVHCHCLTSICLSAAHPEPALWSGEEGNGKDGVLTSGSACSHSGDAFTQEASVQHEMSYHYADTSHTFPLCTFLNSQIQSKTPTEGGKNYNPLRKSSTQNWANINKCRPPLLAPLTLFLGYCSNPFIAVSLPLLPPLISPFLYASDNFKSPTYHSALNNPNFKPQTCPQILKSNILRPSW